MNNDIVDFLKESNNIENEWDDDSLAQALYAWNYVIKEPQLTPGVICKTHKILMLHHLVGIHKGYFRRSRVGIYKGDKLIKEGMSFNDIPKAIEKWCKKSTKGLSLKDGGDFFNHGLHVEYEHIHPFIDGNGRTGRIFMNWQRVKMGMPILVIKEAEKQDYYQWFK